MPESTLKYYPVLVQILLPLEGQTVVTYRAGVVTRYGEWITDHRLLHRFVMEYKGPSFTGTMAANDLHRTEGLEYLARKRIKTRREGKTLEDLVEVTLDLRQTPLTLSPATVV
jgi:hypothetical protein